MNWKQYLDILTCSHSSAFDFIFFFSCWRNGNISWALCFVREHVLAASPNRKETPNHRTSIFYWLQKWNEKIVLRRSNLMRKAETIESRETVENSSENELTRTESFRIVEIKFIFRSNVIQLIEHKFSFISKLFVQIEEYFWLVRVDKPINNAL